ncbi:unnamed protein product [Arabidopsis lyrata]|uniref:putative F-box/kelch-repeat protein At4g19330 n=1 Tax=Arabidopsis lyrata subsp. lyrata TaxID=81972 RepID=UPI000A29B1B5|nr:putative F-box/kelch-repeat protein At4g19330 [Arabidopsis lyrata subsp. lyrata]CAH8276067.1 unnamed protein product [Arabidopsis lyrata]|eukprot:XP_020874449.1 putative F-box/kelch-repeat protein At4g19330 [Arabidopsis lyrata subsp. lyrata]
MEREGFPNSSSSTTQENHEKRIIGEFVSVTINDGKQYEGIICHINLQDSTLGLQNVVRCYGREEKNDNEQRVIHVLKEAYSYMLFSGSDIKLLEVLSLPAPPKHKSVIGHLVSIITTGDVRCEGLITHVNFRDSMIFMKNGMCYGTEGRTKRRRSIVACKQLAGPIHFKFRDIKDLEITFLPPHLHEETASESDDFPPLSRTHLAHRPGGV